MRPKILNFLFTDIRYLKGIGNRYESLLTRLVGGNRIIDLLWHLPINVIDRRNSPPIAKIQKGEIVTLLVEIVKHEAPVQGINKKRKIPYKIVVRDESGFLYLVFFNAKKEYLQQVLPEGTKRVISGRVDYFAGKKQITHPDYIEKEENIEKIKTLEPIYPTTQGISNKFLNKTMKLALEKIPDLAEWIDSDMLQKRQWPSWKESMTRLHIPNTPEDVQVDAKIRARLAYDEALANQLALKITRSLVQDQKGKAIVGDSVLRIKLFLALPFKLTNCQKNTACQIFKDMQSENRMMRLLQGDVGSGKTVVALFAMLQAVEAKMQTCLLAPTSILAKQHYDWIKEMTKDLEVRTAFLCSATPKKQKTEIISKLVKGEIDIIIGTHALIEDNIKFYNLGLTVIDEQHRFGVKQRMKLVLKGDNADILLMSATPIPRTLNMVLYRDMECSIINEKPSNRKEIITRVMPEKKVKKLMQRLKKVIDRGEKIYWICPLIEKTETSELTSATERYNELASIFGNKVALIHSRIKMGEREKIMNEFKNGDIAILVSTTVIEVGIDVKDATVIIIENSENFGLPQLHQLRGRVGRGDKESSCILLYRHLSKTAKLRLNIMRRSNDGFFIAEEDLKIRGAGQMLGTKQSGMPEFKFIDIYEHYYLLKIAVDDAYNILVKRYKLNEPERKAFRTLLHLFGYDKHIKYLC